MSKITVSIGSKDFDIKLEDDFSEFFEKDFRATFGEKKTIETKDLLWAYVQKTYDEFQNEKEFKALVKKIDEV